MEGQGQGRRSPASLWGPAASAGRPRLNFWDGSRAGVGFPFQFPKDFGAGWEKAAGKFLPCSRRGRGGAFGLAAHRAAPSAPPRGWGREIGAQHRSGRAGGCRNTSGPGTSRGAHPWGTRRVARSLCRAPEAPASWRPRRCHQTPAATPSTPSPCGAGTPGSGRAARRGNEPGRG